MAGSLVFLTPTAALVALGALLPLAALFVVRRRARKVRGVLGLAEPSARRALVAIVAVIAAGAFLGVAAAQPVVERTLTARTRTDSEAFVVVDVSRSMLGQEGKGSPMRIERAKQFAVALRASLPEIPFGVASMTDRVLPHLLPERESGRLSGHRPAVDRHREAPAALECAPERDEARRTGDHSNAAILLSPRAQAPRGRPHRRGEPARRRGAPTEPLSRVACDCDGLRPVLGSRRARLHGQRSRGGLSARSVLARTSRGPCRSRTGEGLRRRGAQRRTELRAGPPGSGPTVVQGERGSRIALAPYFAAAALAPLVLLLWRRDR